MKKVLISLALLFLLVKPVFSADAEISCNGGGSCSPATSPAIFPLSEVWYPGKNLTKIIKINNTSSDSQKIGVRSQNTSTTGDLDEVLKFTIKRSDSSQAWDETLNSFYNAGEITLLNSLSSGSDETFSFTVSMNSDAGNEYQDKETKFDLLMGFIAVESPPGPTATPGPGDGGGGAAGPTATPAPAFSVSTGQTLGLFAYAGYPGFETVLGEATAEAKKVSESIEKGEIKGTTFPRCSTCIWWQILLGELIVLLIYYLYLLKKKQLKNLKKPVLVALVIPALAYLVFYLLNRACFQNFITIITGSIYCQYFWLLDIIIYAIISWYWRDKQASSKNN